MPTDASDIEYWLALLRAPTIGAVKFKHLLTKFGSPKQIFDAGIGAWRDLGFKENLIQYLQQPAWPEVEKELQWLAQPNNFVIPLNSPDYPPLLHKIHDPPPLLFVHGDHNLLKSHQIAIVGTRHASSEGIKTAQEFAFQLANIGLTITSGMAVGIDAASHQGTLNAKGKTIAVAGTGLDRVYPAQHRDLAHRIAENGALVSEFTLGTTSQKGNFPRRNRIISGLSLGCLVIEASFQSGALITAQQALEQGREVFAVPGSIYNTASKGCHKLLKEGAKLVEIANDVIEELLIHLPLLKTEQSNFTIHPTSNTMESVDDLEEDYKRLLEHMRDTPTSIDSLVELSQLTVREISSMLLILELRGLVISQPGGLYARLS